MSYFGLLLNIKLSHTEHNIANENEIKIIVMQTPKWWAYQNKWEHFISLKFQIIGYLTIFTSVHNSVGLHKTEINMATVEMNEFNITQTTQRPQLYKLYLFWIRFVWISQFHGCQDTKKKKFYHECVWSLIFLFVVSYETMSNVACIPKIKH